MRPDTVYFYVDGLYARMGTNGPSRALMGDDVYPMMVLIDWLEETKFEFELEYHPQVYEYGWFRFVSPEECSLFKIAFGVE